MTRSGRLRGRGVIVVATLAGIVCGACTDGVGQPVSESGVSLLIHNLDPSDVHERGVLDGQLWVVDGCISVGGPRPFGHGTTFPMWPSEYKLQGTTPAFKVIDAAGNVVAAIGMRVRLVGDGVSLSEAQAHGEVPGPCRVTGTPSLDLALPQHYWLVAKVISPQQP
jgi:hypothetical protein